MKPLYNFLVTLTTYIIPIIGTFNQKLRKGNKGRKNTFPFLENKIIPSQKLIWFHCASFGEYEQGAPVFEQIRKLYSEYQLLLTFTSPSGYEAQQNTSLADIVVYLPWDTPTNSKKFIKQCQPEFIIFVKNEIWPNYLYEIVKNKIPAYLISATFKENHFMFSKLGVFMKKSLSAFHHIFVQNKSSASVLDKNGFHQVSISGDTRFDRVYNKLSSTILMEDIEHFIGNNLTLVLGSTWEEDEDVFLPFINQYSQKDIKIIIAPHEIHKNKIASLSKKIEKPHAIYSRDKNNLNRNHQLLILDTIGMLSKLYKFAHIAYIGGGMGYSGLHNILEPAVFGIPIIIGKNYDGFPEAQKLTTSKGVISIKNALEFSQNMNDLYASESLRKMMGEVNRNFIFSKKGATEKIISTIHNYHPIRE